MFYYSLIILIFVLDLFINYKQNKQNGGVIKRVDSKKRKGIFCFSVILILILLAGLRGINVGRDTLQYEYIFNQIRSTTNFYKAIKISDVEIGYTSLAYFVSRFASYQVFLFIVALLGLGPVGYIFYRYSKIPILSFIIFISFPIYTMLSFSALRQGIAFGIILVAFHFAQKEKLYFYISTLFIGFLFHASVIIFLPVYWIRKIKISNIIIPVILGTVALGIIFKSILYTVFVSYARMNYAESNGGGEATYIFYLSFIFVSLLFKRYMKGDNSGNAIYLWFLVLTVFIWPLCTTNPALFRLPYYFNFFFAIYVSNFLTQIKPNIIGRLLIVLVIIYCMASINELIMRPVLQNYPYEFYWE